MVEGQVGEVLDLRMAIDVLWQTASRFLVVAVARSSGAENAWVGVGG